MHMVRCGVACLLGWLGGRAGGWVGGSWLFGWLVGWLVEYFDWFMAAAVAVHGLENAVQLCGLVCTL